MLALNKIHGTPELVMLEGTHPTRTISIGEWTETTRTYMQPYPTIQKIKSAKLACLD
jgi:hypothetical protein